MLQELLIKDFAIIEELRLEFGPGLNLITGETGAGKSIVIDALQTLLGAKSSSENIREGSKESVLEGTFLIPPSFPLRAKYHSLNYIQENDQEIIIRRIISATGKSRSYLNGNMVNQAALSELSEILLEIHGQNQQISLFKKSVQLSLLDSYAGLEETVFEFEKLYHDWTRSSSSLRKLTEGAEKEEERRSFLKFQVEELESAGLDPHEEIRLEEERGLLVRSEFLKARSESAYHLLSENEENAVLSSLQAIQKEISEISAIDARGIPILQLISSALIQLKETAVLMRGYRETIESRADSLESIEKRLYLLSQLKKKYAPSVPELIEKLEVLTEELEGLNHLESDMSSLKLEMLEIEKKLEVLAVRLSKGRKSAIVSLEKEVVKELKTLKIKDSEFKVRFTPLPSQVRFSRHGQEEVVFLISMNPGFPPVEIEKAASGGELSRLMLVLKSILSQAESVPLLIFDEIDTGVGGEVAELIGKKLWNLAREKQVFCITHLPQIACFGEIHFNISKRVKRGKTEVVVKRLNDQERIQEIGRMLGGSIVTSNTIKFAEELMAKRIVSPRPAAQRSF